MPWARVQHQHCKVAPRLPAAPVDLRLRRLQCLLRLSLSWSIGVAVMVIALKPGKFYGNSLPRPRILPNVPDEERVDPPQSVNGSLLRWAADASWRMGGLSKKTKRFHGKIEGRLSKLREMKEDSEPEPEPEEEEKLPAAKSSSAVSSLKRRGWFGGQSSHRSSRWKPHRKRSSGKKAPLRLTAGKDLMEKLDRGSAGSEPDASRKRVGAKVAAAPDAKRPRGKAVKRELTEEDLSEHGSDSSGDEEEEEDEEAQVESLLAKIKSGAVPLRRSSRLQRSV